MTVNYVATDDAFTQEARRTLAQTQATPAADINAPASQPQTFTQPGAGANPDDNTVPNNTVTQQIVNASAGQRISPEPNVLDQYASYTYAISWYMLTPTQFNSFKTGQINPSSWSLLMQDGGAQITPGNNAGGRNSYFTADYYMDNLEIDSVILGKASGGPNTTTNINFTVTEPNGFTLIDNLHHSAIDLFKQNKLPPLSSWQQIQYCLMIQFYGYDTNGNLVSPARGNITNNPGTFGGSIIQKYFPFVIKNLTTRIVNKQIEYKVECAPIPYYTGLSSARGTIPFPYEFSGTTIGEVLNGKPGGGTAATNQATDGRTSTSDVPQALKQAPSNEYAVNDKGEGIY